MLYAEAVGQAVKVGLRHDAVVDDEGIGEVATTDEAHLDEGSNLADKHEGAGCGEIGREATEVGEAGALRRDKFAIVEIDGGLDREIRRGRSRLVGSGEGSFNAQPAAALRVAILDGVRDGEVVTGLVLLKESDAANLLDEVSAAAVENGELGAIDLDEAVVDAAGKECGHGVLYGGNANVVVARKRDNGAARGVDNILGKGCDDGLTGEIDALHLKAKACGGREECGRKVEACMETLAAKGERG